MKYDTYCFEGRDIKSILTPLCTHLQTLALVFLLTLLSSISASSCEQNTFLSIELRENNCRWRFYLLTTKTCLWTTYKKLGTNYVSSSLKTFVNLCLLSFLTSNVQNFGTNCLFVQNFYYNFEGYEQNIFVL